MTILGLLLVVSFVANYLGTTLPRQMTVNDVNHEILIENQLGHLSAVLERASLAGRVNVPVTQPISLGSEGVAPFGSPDGGSISGIPSQPNASASFGLFGTNYEPPVPGRFGVNAPACHGPPTDLTCPGNAIVTGTYNNQNNTDFLFTLKGAGGDEVTLTYATNSSNITIDAEGRGGGFENITILGNNNNADITAAGNASQIVLIVGNYNNVTLTETSNGNVSVVFVGAHDFVRVTNSAGQSNDVNATGWGTNLTFKPGKGGLYKVSFIGFNPKALSSPICPRGNLASYDRVERFDHNSKGSGTVTYYNSTGPAPLPRFEGAWYIQTNVSAAFPCIFYAQFRAAPLAGLLAASLVVHVANRYTPPGEIAFDQGAVIFAQAGGVPYMVDPPAISYRPGHTTVWVPALVNPVVPQSGTGSVVLTLRMQTVQTYSFPGGGWQMNPFDRPLTLVFHTPYYAAWMRYYCALPAYSGHVTLALATGNMTCDSTTGNYMQNYEPGGPMGTVTLRLPTTSLVLRLGAFSLAGTH